MRQSSAFPDSLRKSLEAICGPRWVSVSDADRRVYAKDMWPRLILEQLGGRLPKHAPQCIVWPDSERQIAQIVQLARKAGVPIVPYGGGSGVCGGVVPLEGGITIDVKRLDRVLQLDKDELVVSAQAGINGERLERHLARHGYSLGHFPSSIYCSTLGGWLATRAAGQLSTKYGKIEDRVLGLSLVTGQGEMLDTDVLQRATRGPNWNQLILGSEGTLAIVTSARLRMVPAPQTRIFRGFAFETVPVALDAIRDMLQSGLFPAVVRLYDPADTFLGSIPLGGRHASSDGSAPKVSKPSTKRKLRDAGMSLLLGNASLTNRGIEWMRQFRTTPACKLIIGFEGAQVRTAQEAACAWDLMAHHGATDLGAKPGEDWYEHRYAVSYKMPLLFVKGAFVDTFEVAAPWSLLEPLYERVRDAIGKHAVVMAHFSHMYHEGGSIYFTFTATAPNQEASLALYDAIWRDALAAVSAVGGTMSHHHGVGIARSSSMFKEHGEALAIYGALKKTLDPAGIMNPGKHDAARAISLLPLETLRL